jgi:light-regulated signal transduction histidine kinase (bacteriophytochrome)
MCRNSTITEKLNKQEIHITRDQKADEGEINRRVSFKQLIEEIKLDFFQPIKENGVQMLEDFQVKEINYKQASLKSIFYNLISISIKYRKQNLRPVVKVSTFEEDGKTVLSVKDNGLRLNEKQQSKLFSIFSRLHNYVEGTGIGLYTIKRIIENNGGIISVNSEEGQGSEFKVYF